MSACLTRREARREAAAACRAAERARREAEEMATQQLPRTRAELQGQLAKARGEIARMKEVAREAEAAVAGRDAEVCGEVTHHVACRNAVLSGLVGTFWRLYGWLTGWLVLLGLRVPWASMLWCRLCRLWTVHAYAT